MQDDDDGFVLNAPRTEGEKVNLWARVFWMIIIWFMINLSQTILTLATIVQLLIMATNRGEPNEKLSDFGTSLGIWVAKAARYQTGASNVRPWPWSELD